MNHESSESQLTEQQIAEINQHKYFLSEEAGHDVGWEYAEQDWRKRFGGESSRVDGASNETPRPKGLGGFFKRLISKAAV